MNQPNYFEIQATEPKKLVEFYSKVFNWKFTLEPNLPIEYWRIQTESMTGGLLARPTAMPATGQDTNAYVNSMQVADFDLTSKIILENGGQVALDKFAVPGKCWQGYFLDIDNNTFGIFQVDENAQ